MDIPKKGSCMSGLSQLFNVSMSTKCIYSGWPVPLLRLHTAITRVVLFSRRFLSRGVGRRGGVVEKAVVVVVGGEGELEVEQEQDTKGKIMNAGPGAILGLYLRLSMH